MSIVSKILLEAIGAKTVYHTSGDPIGSFRASPMWFEQYLEKAKCRHRLNPGMHTYKVELRANILAHEQYMSVCRQLGVDGRELETDLVSNWRKAMRREEVQRLSELCDGFYHDDYDPCDYSNTIQTIFVFNPQQHARIVEELFAKPEGQEDNIKYMFGRTKNVSPVSGKDVTISWSKASGLEDNHEKHGAPHYVQNGLDNERNEWIRYGEELKNGQIRWYKVECTKTKH